MDIALTPILAHFDVGILKQVSTIDSGLINETYLVETEKGKYILQQISKVFKNVEAIANNIQLVHDQLRNVPYTIPQTLPTVDGHLFYRDGNGNAWRLMAFIPDSITLNQTNDSAIAAEVGRILGLFHAGTMGIDIDQLAITLPQFHDLDYRIRLLQEAKVRCTDEVLSNSNECLAYLEEVAHDFNPLAKLTILARVTHNDPKLNNVLFDQTSRKALCLIDLDTLMPGYIMHDFGDAIRTLCNTIKEDLGDKKEVDFNMRLFSGFAEGYFGEISHLLEDVEWESIIQSLHLMPTIMGIRFLTDYLNGNTYYRVEHLEQNLDRSKNQVALIRKIRVKREEMINVINSLR